MYRQRRRQRRREDDGVSLSSSAEAAATRAGWSVTDARPVHTGLTRRDTMEELELIARTTTRRGSALLLVPTTQQEDGDRLDDDEDEDNESSSDSSLSSEDLLMMEDFGSGSGSAGDTDDSSPVETELEGPDEEEEIVLRMDTSCDDDDDEGNGSGNVLHNKSKKRRSFRLFRLVRTPSGKRRHLLKEVDDVQQYMARREMTKTQEHWNAYTMVPSPVYCIYFLLAGLWISPDLVEQARQEIVQGGATTFSPTTGFTGLANDLVGADAHGCLNLNHNSSWLASFLATYTNMPALPPLPVVAAALAIVVHAPFSFLYHYKYAHALPAGLPRTTHWSRRLDQSMIHVASALMAYATSGSIDFFIANLLYNADCVYRQFKRKVQPRRNKIRIAISCLAYTVPILRRGDLLLFGKLWILLAVASWLFGQYPIGGWSHSVFHLVMAFVPPLLMSAACDLPASQEQMRVAAYCVVEAMSEKQ